MKNWKKVVTAGIAMAISLSLSTGVVMASPKQGWNGNNKNKGNYQIPAVKAPVVKVNVSKKINLKDINGHWAQGAMSAVYMQGIVKGYSDLNFKPEGTITKNEALTMLTNMLGADKGSKNKLDPKTARNVPEWARGSLNAALDREILSLDELRNYNGNAVASRYEIATWMARALGLDGNYTGSMPFADANQIPARYRNCVANIYSHQIMTGYPGGYFRPNQPIKRAEMATLMITLLANAPVNPNYQVVKGKVKDIDDDSISLFAEPYRIHPKFVTWRDLWNMLRNETYLLSDDVVVFLNGKPVEPEDIARGANATLVINKDDEVIVILATGKAVDDNDDDNDDDDDDVDDDDRDTTGSPTVEALNPADGTQNVNPAVKELSVTFSEDIEAVKDLGDVRDGIEVKNITDVDDIAIDYVSINGDTLKIKLYGSLEAGKAYRVTIDGDVLCDRDGKEFAGIFGSEWDFTTGDGINPVVETLIPSHEDSYVNPALKTLTVKFNENVRPVRNLASVAAGITVKRTSGNEVLALDPDRPVSISGDTMIIFLKDSLVRSNSYGVTIEDEILEDESGNNFSGIDAGEWTFSTYRN